jgi:glycosyltransferase involved in cell wall biosynthesis
MTSPRIAFVLEQTLGHITHAANLRALVGAGDEITPVFAPIEYDVDGWPGRIPGYGNWTVRAGLRARRAIRAIRRDGPIDAMFVHTQVPAILIPDVLRRIPTVVSLDATPIQYDELGEHYGHDTGGARTERLKWRANRDCFAAARAVVTWAEWTKHGLVDRYEVPADKITVIPPGVDPGKWTASTELRGTDDAPVRVLFVGGDLARKGGLTLIDAVRRLRIAGADVELDLVTRDDIEAEPGIRVHHGLGPNSAGLIELYQRADVFCLPTLGDCLPMVLSEAGAVGLPLVSTDVGAISEIVRPERTGLLVPPNDPEALTAALGRLAGDPGMRRKLGEEARRVVTAEYDAAANAKRLVELLVAVARQGRAR